MWQRCQNWGDLDMEVEIMSSQKKKNKDSKFYRCIKFLKPFPQTKTLWQILATAVNKKQAGLTQKLKTQTATEESHDLVKFIPKAQCAIKRCKTSWHYYSGWWYHSSPRAKIIFICLRQWIYIRGVWLTLCSVWLVNSALYNYSIRS